MKHQLVLILDHGELVDSLFKELSINHFNATVLSARSIKHLIEDEETEHLHFLSIAHLDQHLNSGSTTCYFIVDDDRIDELKKLIRINTDSFRKIKGAMFTFPLHDYEGTI
mgnify:CR=1 FL=1